MDEVPITVVVPTIGRAKLLDSCLASIASCRPAPAEIIVVDQSGDPGVAAVVARWSRNGARMVACDGRGFALGTNLGVRSAANQAVLVTNDDCTVAVDWAGAAWQRFEAEPTAITTGQVRPGSDPDRTPSVITRPEPRDYTGNVDAAELYPGNMLVPKDAFLGLGGFDERPTLSVAAEDNDYCYRWLRAGGRMAYRPELVVWHHDWRTEQQLIDRYVAYGRGEGAFIAKHLHAGDLSVLRFLGRDVLAGARSLLSAVVKRRRAWTDPRRGLIRGLPLGLVEGWREARRLGRAPRASSRRVEAPT